jgi:CDP-diacylglycerol--serine O-phosphatidyltransferase
MKQKRPLRRGIYLLPTVFTLGNLLCGFTSLLFAARGEVSEAAVLIVIAGILDGLDGRIARLTGATSEFGVQFDTLADIVSFGVAPAFLAHAWALAPLQRLGWVLAFIFLVCTAMRLARFNIQASRGDKRYFAGLPSPPAAGAVAAAAFVFPEPATGWITVLRAMLVVLLALLMISRFRYRSFKEVDLRDRRSYVYVLPVAIVLVGLALQPRVSMVVVGVLYVLSAPVAYVSGALRRGLSDDRVAARDEAEIADEPAAR